MKLFLFFGVRAPAALAAGVLALIAHALTLAAILALAGLIALAAFVFTTRPAVQTLTALAALPALIALRTLALLALTLSLSLSLSLTAALAAFTAIVRHQLTLLMSVDFNLGPPESAATDVPGCTSSDGSAIAAAVPSLGAARPNFAGGV